MIIDQTKQAIISEFHDKFSYIFEHSEWNIGDWDYMESIESFLSKSLDRLEKKVKEEICKDVANISISEKTHEEFDAAISNYFINLDSLKKNHE